MKSRSFLRKSRGIHLAETKPPTGFCKNTLSGHPEERKTAKTAFRGTPKSRKQRKLQILRTESSEIGENRISQLWENQKHPKTAFPNFGKSKITQKQHFPTLIRLFFLIFAYKIKDMIWK